MGGSGHSVTPSSSTLMKPGFIGWCPHLHLLKLLFFFPSIADFVYLDSLSHFLLRSSHLWRLSSEKLPLSTHHHYLRIYWLKNCSRLLLYCLFWPFELLHYFEIWFKHFFPHSLKYLSTALALTSYLCSECRNSNYVHTKRKRKETPRQCFQTLLRQSLRYTAITSNIRC